MTDRTTYSKVKPLLATPEPPELGPGPRTGVEPLESLSRRLESALQGSAADEASQQLIKAVVFLWHDHLDASHKICQHDEGADGSYVHGIMHRREPEFGNAKYWFRRVGRHPCFPELALRAGALLEGNSAEEMREQLMPRGNWDAFAMVDVCEELEGRPGNDAQVRWVRRIQALELEILLDRLCA